MHQVLQDVRQGRLHLAQAPAPLVQPGEVLVANRYSLISAGTERMVMELAKKSLLGKARERPDHVRRVLEKIRSEGLANTIRQVREKLDSPLPMGYSAAGVVLACGDGVHEYKPGDAVATNGHHAEIVSVPKRLTARIPDGAPLDQASFAVLGSIAMQGFRLAEVSLGETVLVIGLGLVGQLAVALAKAAGCRVIGADPDRSKCELAIKMGADVAEPGIKAANVEALTGGLGADAVLICASTKSNQPIEFASAAVRKRGRIVLVGVVGLELDRRPFYFKEAEFVVSCSYGPGRYDAEYEDRGRDYPAAYVRWTEQRNMQAVLDLLGAGRLDLSPLISHRFPIERAEAAYELIETGAEPYVGILLEYPESNASAPPASTIVLKTTASVNGKPPSSVSGKQVGIGVLGAGNFARLVLLPAIQQSTSLYPRVICSSGGVSAAHTGRKLDFELATADEDAVFSDEKVHAVFSITRHDQHARHVLKAIRAGKAVFVEKPLCLTLDELAEIEAALGIAEQRGVSNLLMVGFNRRFSPAAKMVKEFLAPVQTPLTISVRFNAGAIPADDWTQNPEVGGGRIIGEACHAIDLATYLAGSPPVRVFAESVRGGDGGAPSDDQSFITLRHENGSISNIAYLAGGDRAYPKERVEVFGGGRVAAIDDFRSVTTCAGGKMKVNKLGRQDKGHQAEVAAFANSLASGAPAPILWSDIRAVTLASMLAVRSLREGYPIDLSQGDLFSQEERASDENPLP